MQLEKPPLDYEITQLSDELIFIRWYATPRLGSPSERQFLADLRALLDNTQQPIYFVSDLRNGRIINLSTIQKLGKLFNHTNWGGSTAFSSDPITSMMVGMFSRFAHREKPEDEIWNTPEEALAYLETIKPGLTEGIDWAALLGAGPSSS